MEILVKERIFGKNESLQPVTLSKKGTPLQLTFDWFVHILRAPPSRKTSKKKKAAILKFNAYHCTQGILLFIFSRWRFNVWLIDGRPLIKIKLIRLVNRVYFQVRSVTKKWNMGSAVWKYSVESTVHGTWKQYGNTVYVCWCQNNLRQSTTRPHSHVTAFLTSFIVIDSVYFLPYRFTNIILCY